MNTEGFKLNNTTILTGAESTGASRSSFGTTLFCT